MDGFETFDVISYDGCGLNKKEKFLTRVLRSRAFKVFMSVIIAALTVCIGLIIYNDIEIRGVNFADQRFSFGEVRQELSSAVGDDNVRKININTATEDGLKTIENIGTKRAAYIVAYRNENGRFRSVEEIMNVKSIDEDTYYSIKDYIMVE